MTFTEWKVAVKNEYESLNNCYEYLNGDGRNRMEAYFVLNCIILLYGTAKDIYEAIQKVDYFKINNSTNLVIRQLGEIATKE